MPKTSRTRGLQNWQVCRVCGVFLLQRKQKTLGIWKTFFLFDIYIYTILTKMCIYIINLTLSHLTTLQKYGFDLENSKKTTIYRRENMQACWRFSWKCCKEHPNKLWITAWFDDFLVATSHNLWLYLYSLCDLYLQKVVHHSSPITDAWRERSSEFTSIRCFKWRVRSAIKRFSRSCHKWWDPNKNHQVAFEWRVIITYYNYISRVINNPKWTKWWYNSYKSRVYDGLWIIHVSKCYNPSATHVLSDIYRIFIGVYISIHFITIDFLGPPCFFTVRGEVLGFL